MGGGKEEGASCCLMLPTAWSIKRQLIVSFGALVGISVAITILVSGTSIGVTGHQVPPSSLCGSTPLPEV
jgi:hypothetical protein